jgi:DNA modification methylase
VRKLMKDSPISTEVKEKSKVSKEEWREFTKTVWPIANTSHAGHPAIFPVEIPERLIKLFSFYGETVLDPFSGTGSTAQAAIPLGRNAVCVEQNEQYVEIIQKSCESLRNGRPVEESLVVVKGDSRKLTFLKDDSIDLVVTSPPYWNKANYGDNPENLGKVEGYREFFTAIRPVFEECVRVLRPGRKLCLVTANVNQYTDYGLLTFPLAADFTVLLREVGLVMVGEVIWSKDRTGGRWGSAGAQRPIFGSYPYPPNFLFKTIHEHILIFAKPPLMPITNPKALPYAEIMGLKASNGAA